MISLIPLLVQYNENLLFAGDLSGFIGSIYSGLMGQYFAGAILLTIFVLTYLRTGEILYGAIVWILVSGSLEVLIPSAGMGVAKIFLILGVASGLFSLFTRNRRSSG